MLRRVNKKSQSMTKTICCGVLMALLVSLCVAVITTFLIAGENIGIERAGYGSGLALLLGAFFGSLTAASGAGQKRMAVCLASGAIYLVILLSVTALMFDGLYSGVGVSALLILGASATAGLISMKKGGSKGRKKYTFS